MARRPVAITAALAALVATVLASLALAAGREAGAPHQRAACPDATESAVELEARELRRSVRCLVNVARESHERERLTRDGDLQEAAQRHAETMVATDCLAHQCGDELELEERIRRAGYFVGADSWQYAESTGCGASAKAMVSNWLANRFHRVNILERTYSDIGVGVVQDPVEGRCEAGYATFAVVFGWRTPPPA